jgi:O-antigen/teichoic acid export membrane protein
LSLVDKVIKNTFYYIFSQVIAFVFPLLLTPYIISKIGDSQFGIYALILGFVGTFGLLDLSMSSSFVKFISEFYNKKDYERLFNTINTGFLFYFIFSVLISIFGFAFTDKIISIVNIQSEYVEISKYALRLSIIIFFIANSFNVFSSVLISLQRMYITSILNTITGLINFLAIIIFLNLGYGLISMVYSQLITTVISTIVTVYYSIKYLPKIRFRFKLFNKESLKYMGKFGLQMQISKLSTFASEKYDEFLLGFFSVMSNVAYFNIGNRVVKFGRFFPYQFIVQVAPIAAEFKAKDEDEKLRNLFHDVTKYLITVSAPIFIYIFIFSNMLIDAWMGSGYDISSHIVRILIIGTLINMVFSAPGNSIIPNIGLPKYQMVEGLINLGINLVTSYILIKYYGIVGAAIGCTIATTIASLYVFVVSARLFDKKHMEMLFGLYWRPIFYSSIFSTVIYLLLKYQRIFQYEGRLYTFILLIVACILCFLLYAIWLFKSNYLNDKDKDIFIKFIKKFLFFKNTRNN